MRGDAVFDETGRYRYRLARRWGPGPAVAFVMLNPSSADGIRDDATIRRCIGFARRWGYGAVEVLNLFGYRTADPRELAGAPDPVGPRNDRYLERDLRRAAAVVCAWGAAPLARTRTDVALALLRGRGAYCLGLTRGGMPRHPLYLRASTHLVPFNG